MSNMFATVPGQLRALLLAATLAFATAAAPLPRVELWRLDCGTFVTKGLVNSCYLIRHGDRLMLWDTGFGGELVGQPPAAETRSVLVRKSLVSQLAELGLKPEQVEIVALSHLHWDHIGQAASFPKARLLIGREDWEALTATLPDSHLEPFRLAPWINGAAPKDPVTGDRDIFGDGSVVMIATPGHTAGHHALLVRLRHTGAVLLTGDLYYSAAQAAQKLIPKGNADAGETMASFRRFDALATAQKAVVIIQHEPGDVAKLPLFPKGAE
ncbi:MAG: beta-lactamase protein [Sphingomonas bacterium]|uniref:N-acyl homoserine lactonase family protein n=1 Tax=Sphingomonas bacterium TaxID=1895847 RepID=UPI002608D7AB|nr:N-acyl homoserine lactonase family protein [Sphingomonas bacterium]MDB5705099.1 beta-lactamase protein [Sphingomonas bacterium]